MPLSLGTISRWKRSSRSSGDVPEALARSEVDRGEGDVQRVDEVGLEELADDGGAAAEAYVLPVGRRLGLLQRLGRRGVEEVERRVAQREARAEVVGEHEDRGVERRLVTPPALPVVVLPRARAGSRTCCGP